MLALLAWSLLGRLHLTGTPLAMSFLIAGWTGSYAVAGVVGAALMVGFGVAGPVRGRAADQRGAGGLVIVTGVIYGVGLTVFAFLPGWLPASWWPVAALAAFAVGMCNPPVPSVSRATWPRMLQGSALTSMYTIDATLTEVLYAVGPMLAATMVAAFNPVAAMVLCGALATFGAVGFAGGLKRAGMAGPVPAGEETRAGGRKGLFAAPGVATSLVVSLCLVGALITVDMTIVAWARDMGVPIMAGVLGAVWSAGSAVGGLVAGGLAGHPRLTFRMTLNLIGLAVLVPVLPPVFAPGSPWLIGVVLFFGGAAIAPAVAASNIRLGELAPPERRAEAFGWLSTAATTGFAIAMPLAGFLLDHGGPALAAGGAVALGAAAALLSLRIPVAKPVVPANERMAA